MVSRYRLVVKETPLDYHHVLQLEGRYAATFIGVQLARLTPSSETGEKSLAGTLLKVVE